MIKWAVIEFYSIDNHLDVNIIADNYNTILDAESHREAILNESDKLDVYVNPQMIKVIQYAT